MHLRDFIERRQKELDAEEAPIVAEIDKLRRSLRMIEVERLELAKALDAIEKIDSSRSSAELLPQPIVRARRAIDGTMKTAVLDILSSHPNGMSAIEILADVNRILGTNYLRTSLSPQLSRLKSEEKIILDGNVWKLAPIHLSAENEHVENSDVFADDYKFADEIAEEDMWGEPIKDRSS